ncbi:hypothetical protein HYR65_01095 [Candidatus Azambacteria bacterium]|nr:hypothetical protein [Candidatus Azambacteria bacterium]
MLFLRRNGWYRQPQHYVEVNMKVLLFVIAAGIVFAFLFRKKSTMVRCPKCHDSVSYLTKSIEGKYPSVCQECAEEQWRNHDTSPPPMAA